MKKIYLIVLLMFTFTLSSCGRKRYLVYLDYNNGRSMEQTYIKNINEVLELDVPNYSGYDPLGWYVDSSLEKPLTKDINIKNIKVLYFKWDKSTNDNKETFINIFEKALANHKESNNYKVTTRGTAAAGPIVQKIFSEKRVNEDEVYLYNSSYGTFAKTFVLLQKMNDNFSLKKGTPTAEFEIDKVSYNKDVTLEEYLNVYGVSPYDLNYKIDKSTILDVSVSKETEDFYIFKVNLTDTSAKEYKKYIIGINSKTSKDVMFKEIELTFEITKDFYFNKISYNETYSIDIKVIDLSPTYTNMTIVNTIDDVFLYN